MHPVDTQAQFEPQVRVVAQQPCDRRQELAAHVQGQLVAVDDDLLDGVVESTSPSASAAAEPVGDVVEVAAVGRGLPPGSVTGADQSAVPGGVAGASDAEHAAATVDHVGGDRRIVSGPE